MKNPTSKAQLLAKLEAVNPEDAKKELIKLFKSYLNPAFGALPKKENDIVMFQALQTLSVFSSNPDQYSMLSSLRVSKPKARNLLYESNLRKDDDLDTELKTELSNPILLKDNDKVCFEVNNPLLIDHLKHTLKRLGHISDGSFSPDIVKITPKAYKALLNDQFDAITKEELNEALIKCGAKKEVSAKAILVGVLKSVGKKVLGEVGDELAENVGDSLEPLFDGGHKIALNYLQERIGSDAKLLEE
jgi:hypothetical protein